MTLRSDSARRSIRPLQIVLGFVATLALLAACGAPAPVPGIEIDPSTNAATVLRGASVDVDVVLTRSGGATGPIALSATGLPSGVTASFAPPSLDGAATTSVLTLTASTAATDGTASVTITADGASLTDAATLSLAVESLEVGGRVEALFGIPLEGIAVSSQGASTFTDSDGAFSLDGLAVPYDLALTAAIGAGVVHVFEGLTTAAPVLKPAFAFGASLPVAQQATVSGNVLGGAAVTANRAVIVCTEGLDQVVVGCDAVGNGETAYMFNAAWYGAASATVRIHALHIESAPDDTPAAFLGYEAFDLSLTDGAAEVRHLALAPVPTVVVAGSLAAAGGLTITGTIGAIRFGPRLSMQLFASTALVDDVAVLMPALSGATYDFTTFAGGPSGQSFAWTVDHEGDFGTLTSAAPLAPVAPASGAVNVDLTTPFTSSGSDEVRTYFFEAAGPGPLLALTTNRAAVTVPDPGLGGFAFPAGASYDWFVLGHGETDADAALDRSLLDYFAVLVLGSEGGPGYDRDGVFTLGPDRTFTFAP